jgi:hypothetical protein
MDDLVKRLRDPAFGTETSERNLMSQAAARVAELEAAHNRMTHDWGAADRALLARLEAREVSHD